MNDRNARPLPRFFAPDAVAGARTVTLPADEAHHAARVLRLRRGDAIVVFDGRGGEWRAAIAELDRAGVRVELLERTAAAPEPSVPITLLQAVLKGDHMDAVVRDATMLGVAAIVPVVTARTIGSAGVAAFARARDRWARVAIASAKQCRRASVPSIAPAAPLAEALAAEGPLAGCRILLAEPAVVSASEARDALGARPPSAVLAVGPEGGWTPEEMEAFRAAGFRTLTLGTLTLRADAAALVAISMLRARWGDT